MTQLWFAAAVGLVAAMGAPPAVAQPLPNHTSCPLSMVTISKVRNTYDDGETKVTGIVRQDCHEAVGVGLTWTGYYADGSVAFTREFWPNVAANIPANTDFPFEVGILSGVARHGTRSR